MDMILPVVFCVFFSQACAVPGQAIIHEAGHNIEKTFSLCHQMRLTNRCPYSATTVTDEICCLSMHGHDMSIFGKLKQLCCLYARGFMDNVEEQMPKSPDCIKNIETE